MKFPTVIRAMRSIFFVFGFAAASVAGCNLFVKFEDCREDSDCPAGLRCNRIRHLCHVPPVEECNGRDDDNDGVPDDREDFGRCQLPVPMGMRACRDGTWVCSRRDDGSWGHECVRREPSSEVCNNGVDEDCNGIVDDGADCMVNYPATQGLTIGSNNPEEGEGDDAPAHQVCLDAFSLDRYEVTIDAFCTFLSSLDRNRLRVGVPPEPMNPTVVYGRYLLFEENGRWIPLMRVQSPPDALSIDQLAYSFAPHVPENRNLPVVNVTWFGASRYCAWAGKHLPTEAEFFRAARGPTGLRPYPWGSEPPTCERANVGRGGIDGGPCVGLPVAVDQLPLGATTEGVFHLYGNVNEWMYDYLNTDLHHSRNYYYESLPADGGAWCDVYPRGPIGPEVGTPIAQPEDAGLYCVQCRFARGRHYRTVDLRIGIRRWLDADRGEQYVGFRCSLGGAPR